METPILELQKENRRLRDDLESFDGACYECSNSDLFGDPIRHYHQPDGWHWHHMIDPGDGLFDPCKNSDLLERCLTQVVLAASPAWNSMDVDAPHDGEYLVAYRYTEECGAVYDRIGIANNVFNTWRCESGWDLIAWMPLPKFPKENL